MCVATYEAMLPVECRTKAAKAVLSLLAWVKNHQTSACFPKPKYIARMTQFSLSAVYAALVELREDGLIQDTKVRYAGKDLPGFKIIHPERGEIADEPELFLLNLFTGERIPITGKPIPATGIAYSKNKPEPKPDAESIQSESANSPPPPSRRRWSFVPETLSKDMALHAESKGLSEETMIREHESFLAWHQTRGIRFVDWFAAWRGWIARHLDHRRDMANRARRQSGACSSFADAARRAAASLHDEEVRRPDPRDLGLVALPTGSGG